MLTATHPSMASHTPLLSILTLFILSSNTELHNPSCASKEHDRDSDPGQSEKLDTLVRIQANVVPIFVEDMRGLFLNNRDDNRSDEEGKE